MELPFVFSFAGGILGIIAAVLLTIFVFKKDPGDEKVREISKAIREGAIAFLKREYQILFLFVLAIAAIFALSPIGWRTAVAYLLGAILSALTGNFGMRIATAANGRCAWQVRKGIFPGLHLAFSSGAVMGLTVVSLGLLGITSLYFIFRDPQILFGFGFGASSIALFARVGGGIYTKAADVGADLVGKIEKGIPEDDPRNPAVIADNVGDNVGDVAGMGADLFESYVGSIIAAMALGAAAFADYSGIFLPLLLAALGIIVSILGILIVLLIKKGQLASTMNKGIFSAAALMIVGAYLLISQVTENALPVFFALISGLIAGTIIGLVTEYFTSYKFRPTRALSESSQTGAGTNIIAGLGLGMFSTFIPVITVCATIFIAYKFAGLYGIAIAAVGMLSTLGITLASDTYGPVADNAAGIAEMAGLGKEVRERAEGLDAVGNTTAAIGKGFAIGSAALTALVLSVAYTQVAKLDILDLNQPIVLIGLFIGAALPFLFSAFAMQAVGKAAFWVVQEVRRQFKEIAGIMEGKAKPDYARCVSIVTGGALRQMILPSLIALIAPPLIGFTLGKEALGGLLIGAIVSGFLLAVLMANAGGAWDNAKKYIEAGNLGGKGSDTHKAAVVGDTVGDPFKDTAGPSLNILIKLMSIIALILAPFL